MRDDVEVLRALLGLPTAPFREQAVVQYVRRFAAATDLPLTRDRAGNVLLRYRRCRAKTRWVFAAHMDHPGFVVTRRRGRTLWAEFRGSVGIEYFAGSRARFFAPGGEVVAVVESARKTKRRSWLAVRLKLDRPASVPPGTVGMWDLPGVRIRRGRVSARACDDLAGVASVLCALRALARGGVEADVTVLLTRAEEVGLVGALAACRDGSIPQGAAVVGIETSQAQPQTPLGGGVVVRVGDSIRTFDPSLTAHVTGVAARRARAGAFAYRRCLMPGGTCESTVYQTLGHRTAALCLPLGNYHNRGPGGRIAPERIHLDDFASLISLLVELARSDYDERAVDAALTDRLGDRLADLEAYLGVSEGALPGHAGSYLASGRFRRI